MGKVNDLKVASFYEGKSVFITGGTGFLGKTLIEKLLYSCSGIKNVYILVRDKNNKNLHDRIDKLTSSPAFDRLRLSQSKDLLKVIPLAGNITREDLGLSAEQIKILQDEVSIVFHLAATVNFNLPLKDALNINVDGTYEVIQLCRRLKNLQAFVHVSTAFTNSDRYEVKEMVYPMPVTLEDARHIAEENNEQTISTLMGKKPNTYVFSKAYAEELVQRECADIPTAIVRPSVVISSLKEPCPGWIDSWNGATGLFVGMSSGTLKVALGRGTNIAHLVPVDIVTNLCIVAATQCQKSDDVKVYNCCTSASNPITSDGAAAITKEVTLKYSFNDLPWPMLIFTPSRIKFIILMFLIQIIPSFIIDMLSLLVGKKPILMKTQSKLRKMLEILQYFMLNEWKFSDNNVRALLASMSDADKEIFNFDVKTINWTICIEDLILGCRKYLLNINDCKHICNNKIL